MTYNPEMRELLLKNIDKVEMTARERDIMKFRVGLTSPHTLEETGKEFGISKQRVKQIELEIKERIKALGSNKG